MIRRSIILFPKLENAESIKIFRKEFDPLANKIKPHITLVFPFESSIETADLSTHVKSVSSGTRRFSIVLGPAQIQQDGCIWLPVTNGKEIVQQLHDKLYTGILSEFLNNKHRYFPHLTVGKLTCQNTLQAQKETAGMSKVSNGIVENIVIEKILPDEQSEIELSCGLA